MSLVHAARVRLIYEPSVKAEDIATSVCLRGLDTIHLIWYNSSGFAGWNQMAIG